MRCSPSAAFGHGPGRRDYVRERQHEGFVLFASHAATASAPAAAGRGHKLGRGIPRQ